jgi:hypothetical protein
MSSHSDSFAASGSSPTADFEIRNDAFPATIYLLTPLTPAAQAWADEHLLADRMTLGTAIVVEHRFISEIIHAIIRAGLRVRETSRRRRK